LYKRLPSVEEIGVGDAEVYCKNLPIRPESLAVHDVKVITQKRGMSQAWQGGVSQMNR